MDGRVLGRVQETAGHGPYLSQRDAICDELLAVAEPFKCSHPLDQTATKIVAYHSECACTNRDHDVNVSLNITLNCLLSWNSFITSVSDKYCDDPGRLASLHSVYNIIFIIPIYRKVQKYKNILYWSNVNEQLS